MNFPASISIDKSFAENPMFSVLRKRILTLLNALSGRFGFLKKLPRQKSKIVILLVLAVLIIGGYAFFKGSGRNDSQSANNATFVSEGPKLDISKKFAVPIRNRDGEPTGTDLIVNVNNFERTNRILYKGRPLVARSSKDFLVINLEVENSTNNRLTVRPVDFFRLVDTNGKSYAADIQTDPVKVEAQSSKRTRIIYIVVEDQKNLKFLMGEIKGNRETLEVTI